MTRAYTNDELRQLLPGVECAARSGLSLGPEASLRLVATVRDLQRELVQANSRIDDEIARRLERLVDAGIAALERDMAGPGTHRYEASAVAALRALRGRLGPGVTHAVVESQVPEEPAAMGRGRR